MVITIGRQIGSGAFEMAKKLSADLNCKLYDKDLLDIAASESGFDRRFFKRSDEKHSILRNFFTFSSPFGGQGGFTLDTPVGSYAGQAQSGGFSQENMFLLQSQTIQKAAEADNCIFMGRCADYILREMPNLITIFVSADMEDRIQRVMKSHNVEADEAARIIKHKDTTRASYYKYYSGKKWGDSLSYDFCINSSRLGLEKTEALIRDFCKSFV